ncbi:hypothetical protein CR970_00070 [Candidatus Saccharibacteria bacterium]|nr:MAG: hypothetical protein CR970_00070 [Candidatus Saccharibacteria bacterium]
MNNNPEALHAPDNINIYAVPTDEQFTPKPTDVPGVPPTVSDLPAYVEAGSDPAAPQLLTVGFTESRPDSVDRALQEPERGPGEAHLSELNKVERTAVALGLVATAAFGVGGTLDAVEAQQHLFSVTQPERHDEKMDDAVTKAALGTSILIGTAVGANEAASRRRNRKNK